MGNQELLNFCSEKGLLLDGEMLNLFSSASEIEHVKFILEKIKNHTKKRFINKNMISDNKNEINQIFLTLPLEFKKTLDPLKESLGLIATKSFVEKEIAVDLKSIDLDGIQVLRNPPALNKKLEVKDFVNYFRGRLEKMKGILQEHTELENLVSINKISSNVRQNISLIGIVSDKKVTKNKNILLEIEDMTGKVKVLINNSKEELIKLAEEITLDTVLGFKGSGNSEIFFANEIIFPECKLHERKRSPVEEYALFIGDLHVGSNLFMEENFLKFIEYINGNVPNTPEVEKIKYLIVIGDLVAGVGIFPGQENELNILSIEDQYSKVAEFFSKIRKDIIIVMTPGNHDSVRIMEPQPVLDEKFAWELHQLENLILVNNPSNILMGKKNGFEGFNILLYHGYSFHYYANTVPRLLLEKAVHKPDKIMHYLLSQRHLAPTHSSTLYFPSKDDPLIIEDIPDIFFSGHTHKSAISYHNNILVISGSSWESMTPFQEKMGNKPDFCKVPMFNLKTRAVKLLDFE